MVSLPHKCTHPPAFTLDAYIAVSFFISQVNRRNGKEGMLLVLVNDGKNIFASSDRFK
jgi:hypothetical protein